jgi:hypothetical protein
VIHWDRLAALVWTIIWPVLVFFALGFAMMGDCAEDVIRGTHQGPCVDHKHVVAWTIIALGLVVYALGYWLILRKRGR